MRKSDKKENFKRVNLIVENRFLESKGIIKESYHDEYTKYEKIMYIGEPKTFSNGKTVKYGDMGEYVGTEGGEECWVSFPASGFATVFRNIKKVALNEYENGLTYTDELVRVINDKLTRIENGHSPKDVGIGFYLDELKRADMNLFDSAIEKYKNIIRLAKPDLDENFFNRFFDTPSKDDETKKQKAIQEIMNFDFRRLFIQTNKLDSHIKTALDARLKDAARAMPTLKELRGDLFDSNNLSGTHVYMKTEKGETLEGFIPSTFWLIRGQHDLIDNETAKGKLQGYLN